MISDLNYKVTVSIIILIYVQGTCQIQPYLKTGINFGYINQSQWVDGYGAFDNINYGKPLIRPVVSIGLTKDLDKFSIRAGIMYQTKGQGTKVPLVRNFGQTLSPDILHFVSIPIGVEFYVLQRLRLTFSIQPSLFLGGADNYLASAYWRGWIWSGVAGIQYTFGKKINIGFEYDHDFRLYYCPGCDERFLTYRVYTSIPIGQVLEDKHQDQKRAKKKKHY